MWYLPKGAGAEFPGAAVRVGADLDVFGAQLPIAEGHPRQLHALTPASTPAVAIVR